MNPGTFSGFLFLSRFASGLALSLAITLAIRARPKACFEVCSDDRSDARSDARSAFPALARGDAPLRFDAPLRSAFLPCTMRPAKKAFRLLRIYQDGGFPLPV